MTLYQVSSFKGEIEYGEQNQITIPERKDYN